MRYLYGDSTPSPLQSNFLAFLRDAIGFCVHLLQAQERITGLRADGRALDTAAEAERARIAGLRALVLEAGESANTDGPESASQRAVTRVIAAAESSIATTLAEVAAKLGSEHAALAARERAERDRCLEVLGELVAPHEPHEGTWKVAVQLGEAGYTGECAATTSYGIAWTCGLELGKGHPLSGPALVGAALPQLELSLPEPGGFLKKGKVRAQRIDQYSIDAFSASPRESRIALRVTPRTPMGLDIAITERAVQMLRVGGKDGGNAESEISAEDEQRLRALRDRLLEWVTVAPGLSRRPTVATLDDKPLADSADLGTVVERVIAAAAPITNEIQAHSLSPYELVIRRLLGNDRREEVFVTSASLLDKLAGLSQDQRAVFAPLNLKRVRARTPLPGEVEAEADEAIVQTRIRTVTPVAIPVVAPPVPEPAPEAAATRPSEPTIVVEPADGPAEQSVPINAQTKDELAATVKRIVGAARAGRTVAAYEAYAALFEDPDFAQQRVQDQRQVLKLMVLAKAAPPQTLMVTEAYKNALTRLRALAADASDPVDLEMIGACERILERPAP